MTKQLRHKRFRNLKTKAISLLISKPCEQVQGSIVPMGNQYDHVKRPEGIST